MSSICNFDRILKTEFNVPHIKRNCRSKNLDDFGRNEADERRTFKCEGERNDDSLQCEHLFGNVFERRESKYCAVLMEHLSKVKGEQMITLQMA